MQEEIGLVAGKIWHTLDAENELSLVQLKSGRWQDVHFRLGWLAREDKIVITPEKRSFRLRLKHGRNERSALPNGLS